MMKKRMNYFLAATLVLASNAIAFAQDEEEEGPEGPPEAPINRYVLLMAIIAVAFAWHMLKRSGKSTVGQQDV